MLALDLMQSFGVAPRGIIHVGANDGAEFEAYRGVGANAVVYIEPIPSVYEVLKSRVEVVPGHFAVNAICSAKSREKVTLNVASNRGESSSILPLGEHAELFPSIKYIESMVMETSTVDEIVFSTFRGKQFDLMVVDVQGAELLVLKGALRTLALVEAVYVEVSERPLYEGSCTWPQIHAFLEGLGFFLKHLSIGPHFYGNAFYLRNTAYVPPQIA
jgi:FkbM family methyltransferase